jgi:hypothetical protein
MVPVKYCCAKILEEVIDSRITIKNDNLDNMKE